VPAADGALRLAELASRCQQAYGQVAQVWGEPERSIRKVATCSGAGAEVIPQVLQSGADCLITGEVRYHEALALAEAGVALIELGHDISELPYRQYLRAALIDAGFPAKHLVVLGPAASWWHP
jgi:putative NIF3 family GTP cyclohydrolase 1 type 2